MKDVIGKLHYSLIYRTTLLFIINFWWNFFKFSYQSISENKFQIFVIRKYYFFHRWHLYKYYQTLKKNLEVKFYFHLQTSEIHSKGMKIFHSFFKVKNIFTLFQWLAQFLFFFKWNFTLRDFKEYSNTKENFFHISSSVSFFVIFGNIYKCRLWKKWYFRITKIWNLFSLSFQKSEISLQLVSYQVSHINFQSLWNGTLFFDTLTRFTYEIWNLERVSIYVPESSSMLQHFMEWLTGRRPELIDPTILASGGGRERKEMYQNFSLMCYVMLN